MHNDRQTKQELLVVGTITFEQQPPSFTTATVLIQLQDITYADAPAQLVAESIQHDIAFDSQRQTGLPFNLIGAEPSPRGHYTIQVHIDLDGDGTVSKGDFINMQSYPVLAFGDPHEVTIQVRQVK